MTIGIEHYLIVGALLFTIGLFIVLGKRNLIGAFMGVELMLNAVNLTFIAFARFTESVQPITGQVFAVFVITVAAGEAALALGAGRGGVPQPRQHRCRRHEYAEVVS